MTISDANFDAMLRDNGLEQYADYWAEIPNFPVIRDQVFEATVKNNTIKAAMLGIKSDDVAKFVSMFERSEAASKKLKDASDMQVVEPEVMADNLGWLPQIWKGWPTPIAHEYARLHDLLQEGQVIGAYWQLKDFLEVLIKVPGIVMFRDISESEPEADKLPEWRWRLVGKQTSLGDWFQIADGAAMHVSKSDKTFPFSAPSRMFRDKKGQTKLAQCLDSMVIWRNGSIGHGALQFNKDDILEETENKIRKLNALLKPYAEEGIWDDFAFEAGGTLLDGMKALNHLQKLDLPKSADGLIPVVVSSETRSLALSPYISVFRCNSCGRLDPFIYNGMYNKGCGFLDYAFGHSNTSSNTLVESDLRKGINRANESYFSAPESGGYLNSEILAIIDERQKASRVTRPAYALDALDAFMKSRDRGIFWFRADAYVGKSVFAAEAGSKLGKDPKVRHSAVFHIRREFRRYAAQMFNALHNALFSSIGIEITSYMILPPNTNAANPGDVVRWLEEIQKAAREIHGCDRLVMVIDGLDELDVDRDRMEAGKVLSLIPSPSDLPEGVYLVLTSRPRGGDGCRKEVWAAVSAKLEQAPELAAVYDVDRRSDTGLLKVMRKRFEVTEKYLGAVGRPLKDAKLFDRLLALSDHRFMYLSHLCDLLAEGALSEDAVTGLPPRAEDLLPHFLNRLRQEQTHKQNDLMDRIMAAIAACGDSYSKFRSMLPESLQANVGEWKGISLDLLREIAGASPEDERMSYMFVYILYGLKPILKTWNGKGGSGKSFSFVSGYGLNDFVREKNGHAYSEALRRLAEPMHADGGFPRGTTRFMESAAAAMDTGILKDSGTLPEIIGSLSKHCRSIGKDAEYGEVAVKSAFIEKAHTLLSDEERAKATEAAAGAYGLLARHLEGLGDLESARGYRLKSIDMLTERLKAGKTIDLQISLADSFGFIASLYERMGCMEDAENCRWAGVEILQKLADFTRGEGFRRKDIRNRVEASLADAYGFLAKMHSDIGDHVRSEEFRGRSIELYESLIDNLDGNKPFGKGVDLAKSYGFMAMTLEKLGLQDKAMAFHKKGILRLAAMMESIGTSEREFKRVTMARLDACGYYAALLEKNGDLESATSIRESAIDAVVVLKERLRDRFEHDMANRLSDAYGFMAFNLERRSMLHEAVSYREKAVSVLAEVDDRFDGAPPVKCLEKLGQANRYLAEARARAGLPDSGSRNGAIDAYRRLRRILGKHFTDDMKSELQRLERSA